MVSIYEKSYSRFKNRLRLKANRYCQCYWVDARKYSYIETGSQQLTDEILIKLATFYNTSVDYLLCLTDNPVPYPKGRTK